MKISRRKLRKVVAAILFLVSVNSFGIGWWWLNQQNESLLSQHHHVPHPLNHLQENRLLHNKLHDNSGQQKSENQHGFQKPTPDANNEKQPQNREPLLNCSRFGGPLDYDAVQEMVYWKDIPQDLLYQSRYKTNDQTTRRFLTFDTDLAGFNNQRMVFEINLLAAIVTGRTLVMPRRRTISHLKVPTHGGKVAMSDFFDIASIAQDMPNALDVMSVDDFMASEGGPDKLNIPTNFSGFYERTASKRKHTRTDGKSLWIVDTNGTDYHDRFLLNHLNDHLGCNVRRLGRENCSHYTDWIEESHGVPSQDTGIKYQAYFLDQYMAEHPKVFCPKWGAAKCLVAIPNRTDDARYKFWVDAATAGNPYWGKLRKHFVGHPLALGAPPEQRLAQVFWKRGGICVYGQDQQDQQYWHMADFVDEDSRLIGHYYDYLFFEDWREDLWAKRFLRDKMKYKDELQCAAARIVEAIRTLAKELNHGDDTFHTMHIRRTDLTKQYKDFGVDKNASDIYEEFATKRNLLPPGSVVYIATDEQDRSFFDVFQKHYKAVYFLDDFQHLLGKDFPIYYFGMVEQLVCSRGKNFVGTFFSTFTGYINRLRGYHSQNALMAKHARPDEPLSEEEVAVLEQGQIQSWFYSPAKRMDDYQRFTPIGLSLFEMEYAYGWRTIDYDVNPILRERVDTMEATNDTSGTQVKGWASVGFAASKEFHLGADGFVPTKQTEVKMKRKKNAAKRNDISKFKNTTAKT